METLKYRCNVIIFSGEGNDKQQHSVLAVTSSTDRQAVHTIMNIYYM